MVNIKPFCGVRYDPHQFADLSEVVSQPHDRINPDRQEKWRGIGDKDKFNMGPGPVLVLPGKDAEAV